LLYNTVTTDNTDNTEKEARMKLNFSGKQDVYLEIAQKYKEYIELGIIKNGEKLPSVRTAAGEMGVNPNTVAKAYALLEEQGYVRALPKKGAFVTFGEAPAEKEDEHKKMIYALREAGIDKETLFTWIEEVYGK
jgi:GntR family transcriptional regulator